ncbi:MAG: hypothetical protein PHP63_07780 [Candidatus Marinimicrobia bacterium]|nr:hypothetical protein [Candidatus Neomarinimicrobiota bacterium]
MQTSAIRSAAIRIGITDVIALALIYALPALSHALAFPFYMFEPMRIVLFAAYLASRNNINTVLLALSLPLFSMLTAGHPVLPKALIMSAELAVNVLLFLYLLRVTKWNIFFSLLSATLLSKLFYYGLKYLLLRRALIDGALVTTNLLVQLAVALFIAGGVHLFLTRNNTTMSS